jgi:hypothetical protein
VNAVSPSLTMTDFAQRQPTGSPPHAGPRIAMTPAGRVARRTRSPP